MDRFVSSIAYFIRQALEVLFELLAAAAYFICELLIGYDHE